MAVPEPDRAELQAAAAELGLDLDDAAADAYLALIAPNVAAYQVVDGLSEPVGEIPQRAWIKPADNPLGAWFVRTELRTRDDGPLADRTVVLKDNVCLAGLPMMNGASTLHGYVPDVDATVVARLLDAGATIAGKAHCEYFCFSGGSHTNATGHVRNPHKPTHAAGGSSSGSAALVAAGEVDLAIGGDQGGSIRIPSAWCGTVGMKPTHGLVPYTGIMPIEATIDHTGPITANVADNALMLEVIAGSDGLDPRQVGVRTDEYTRALTGDCAGLRIGLVREGFGTAGAEPDVDEAVREAAGVLAGAGAKVAEVSVPLHSSGLAIWNPIALEGHVWQMLLGNGFGMNWRGQYVTSLLEAMRGWQDRADEFSESLKVSMLAGNVFRRRYGGATYAKAQNLVRTLTAAYDAALADFDVLLMPTLPMKATPLPPVDAPRELVIERAFEMIGNTAPFDATGHPALTLPCATSDDLPIGMMLIGRHWDEATLYRAAHAFETRTS
ncbi:amidase [Saccharopolyspora sp. K220]|uniref:amidase n=1 Tax=Saccharopolyspora soli TaxID=2926618 RepID=UPI001F563638|nr:amidase [Saccharopolyspora soli]MCI2420793.1 amidase [Saccharopolyspora soli]